MRTGLPCCLLVAVGARFGLELWLGHEFAERSTRVAQLLALGVAISALAEPAKFLIRAHGKPQIGALVSLVELGLFAVYSVPIISRFGIEGAAMRPDDLGDIGFPDADAGVAQAFAEDFRHRPARPGDDRRHQLRHHDLRLGSERAERGTQRKAHAEPADQHMRLCDLLDLLCCKRGERGFGAREAAVHQLVGAEHDGELPAAAHQAEFIAGAGDAGGVELFTLSGPSGQGHETVYPALVAGILGLAADDVTLHYSDPDGPALAGSGTFGSRSLVSHGSALSAGACSSMQRAAFVGNM